MEPTKPIIRVQGHGRVSTPPDVVVLSLVITSEDPDYGKAIAGMNVCGDALRRSIAEAGEDTKALKTTSFTVAIKNDYVKDRYVFRGFCGEHRLELRLPFDHVRFARVFRAISESEGKPQVSITFSVSDPETIRERVLEDAVKNAHRRATVIAAASRQTLGAIVAIDYGYTEIRVSSDPYSLESPAVCDGAPEIEPSEIESADTVQIAWEINHAPTNEG